MKKTVFNKIVYGFAVWGAFCLLFVAFHIIGEAFFDPSREHVEFWHEKTRAVFSDLELGSTKDEVLEIIEKHSWPENQVSIQESMIVLRTPFEWVARNWWLLLGFEGDKLVSAKVRTESTPSVDIWPLGAPRDLVQPLNEREENK